MSSGDFRLSEDNQSHAGKKVIQLMFPKVHVHTQINVLLPSPFSTLGNGLGKDSKMPPADSK